MVSWRMAPALAAHNPARTKKTPPARRDSISFSPAENCRRLGLTVRLPRRNLLSLSRLRFTPWIIAYNHRNASIYFCTKFICPIMSNNRDDIRINARSMGPHPNPPRNGEGAVNGPIKKSLSALFPVFRDLNVAQWNGSPETSTMHLYFNINDAPCFGISAPLKSRNTEQVQHDGVLTLAQHRERSISQPKDPFSCFPLQCFRD